MLEFIVGFSVGVAVGAWGVTFMIRRALKRAEQAEEVAQEVVTQLNVVPVKLEHIQDTFYLFDDRDDRFLAQGATAQEVVQHLRVRFPRITLNLVTGDAAVIAAFNQQIEDLPSEA